LARTASAEGDLALANTDPGGLGDGSRCGKLNGKQRRKRRLKACVERGAMRFRRIGSARGQFGDELVHCGRHSGEGAEVELVRHDKDADPVRGRKGHVAEEALDAAGLLQDERARPFPEGLVWHLPVRIANLGRVLN